MRQYKYLTFMMESGSVAAVSSMSIPPCLLPMITGPACDLSSTIAKYVSLAISKASATITFHHEIHWNQIDNDWINDITYICNNVITVIIFRHLHYHCDKIKMNLTLCHITLKTTRVNFNLMIHIPKNMYRYVHLILEFFFLMHNTFKWTYNGMSFIRNVLN